MPVRVHEAGAALVGAVSGMAAAMAGAEPTGHATIDVILTGISVALTAWAAASANWWALALAGGVVTATVSNPWLIGMGAVTMAASLAIGTRQHSQSLARAAAAGVVMNLAVRSEFDVAFGLSAVIGCSVALGLIIDGLSRRRHRTRLITMVALGLSGGAAVVASVLVAVAAWSVADEVRSGERLVQRGLESLASGDDDDALLAFSSAAAAFETVEDSMNSVLARPAAVVPVVSQHRTALADMAASAGDTSREIVRQLGSFDLDALRIIDGTVDIDRLRSLEAPLRAMQSSLEHLDSTARDVNSAWLVDAVTRRLTDVQEDVGHQIARGDDVAAALAVAPALLGADSPRTYLVGFVTPAEVRGGGGFLGAMAEMSADNGRIEMTRYWGSIGQLGAFTDGVRLDDAPADWLARYGIYGFTNGADGGVNGDAWSNITLSPHFPSTARVMREMYTDGVGREIDGVFSLDVRALAGVVELTGPIEVDSSEGPITLTSDTLEQFLLIDQYRLESPTSEDILEDVARTTIDQLLRSTLPSPTTIADVLSPLVREGRLTAWSRNQDEQVFFADREMTGALPATDAANGFAITFNNANPSKIDSFLELDIDHTVTFDDGVSSEPDDQPTTAASGTTSSTTIVTITNTVTATDVSGLPEVVVGNQFDLPIGTNRSLVDVFTLAPIENLTIDGEPIRITRGVEAGWSTASFFVDVPPGVSITLRVTTADRSTTPASSTFADQGSVVVRVPPLARAVTGRVTISTAEGNAEVQLPAAGASRFSR